jgi:MFS family permease
MPGYFKTLPLQLTWLSSAFYFIGGGPIVASAIGITMISDIAPPDKRTTIFLYLTASVLIAEIVAPIVSARLMENGDWFPLVLSLGIQGAGILVAVFFPETLHLRDIPEPRNHEQQSIRLQTLFAKDSFQLQHQVQNFRSAYYFLKSDWTLAMVVFTFMANRLGRQAMSLLVRYASKRYSWEIKKAAYLLSFRAATNLVAVAVFIPLVNFVLLRYLRLPSHWADLWLARGSVILTAVSFVFIGLAAYPAMLVLGLLIFNFGTGYNAAMRSVSIHVVGGQASPDIGKLMSTIAIVESVGAMFAGPLLNQMFQWGMDMGSAFLGLPFLAAVVVLILVAVVTFVIDVNDKTSSYAEVESDDEEVGEVQGRTSALEREGGPTYNLI